jgi:hypothetical protein
MGGDHSSAGVTVSFHSQMIGGFLGCYSLACIVLIKMMLPKESSVSFSAALGTDMFTVHAAVINVVFLTSAVISTSVLGMLLGIQRQNNLRHAASSSVDKAYHGPDV